MLGQAVDQVDIHRAKLQGMCRFNDGAGFFKALQAIDGALYLRVEILNTDADPIEAQFAKQAHGRPVGFPGINLDAVVTGVVVEQVEMLAQVRHQLAQFVMTEECRGAAAQMQLFDLLPRVEVAGNHLDFLLQTLQVGQGPPSILGNDLVAGAVVANVRAERYMHIQRQRPHSLAAVAQSMQQVKRPDLGLELHRSGV